MFRGVRAKYLRNEHYQHFPAKLFPFLSRSRSSPVALPRLSLPSPLERLHADGTFDVIHMNDIDHLSHSHLKAHDEIPGHGKLLWDPNLQVCAGF